jgi:hypothetical protein
VRNVPAKLREARFFLRLLTRIEETATPLVGNIHEIRDEFSFVLSGFLNACYAATEFLEPVAGKDVEAFKKLHALVYGKGLRNLTVHERHISPSLSRYISPGGAGASTAAESALTLRFEYYFDPLGGPIHVTSLCESHYQALLAFAAGFNARPDA